MVLYQHFAEKTSIASVNWFADLASLKMYVLKKHLK